jgi:hypothetical protein
MMADQIRQVDYYYVTVTDQPGEAARVLKVLRDGRVNLLGFCGFPRDNGKAQLDFIPEDPAAFIRAATNARIPVSEKKSAFLVQGEDRPGAIAEIVEKLADSGINVTSVQAFRSGSGGYGGMVWINPADLRRAAEALAGFGAEGNGRNKTIDEVLDDSFPASDAPPWTP